MYHCLRRGSGLLEVLAESAAVFKPGERPLHDPASRQDLEALGRVLSPYDLKVDPAMSFQAGYPVDQLSPIASVGPDLADPAVPVFELL